MPIVDPSTIPDDTLRPWIVDDEYDSKVLDAMSAFDETYAQTSYNRNAGQHGDSDLDKIRHDDLMEFSETISGRVSGGEDKEGEGEGEEEKTDYMMVHDDDSVGSNGGEPYMLPFDDESNAEGEELDSVPLGEDDDILKMTSSMNNIDQKRFMKTRTLRLLMEKEKKKREDDFRSGSIRHLHTTSLQKIPSSKYMPTHKTRVYKEWVDAQRELRKETMKEKAYLLDRPTTAFINSLIDKERDILAESFSKQEFTRQAAADDKAAKTIQLEELNITTQKMKETNNQKRCLERFNRLYPDLKVNIPRSPISSSRPVTSSGESSRPATSDGFKMSRPLTGDVDSLNNNDGKHSPLRPLTTENKNKHFGRTKPTFHDRRCDMTLVLGLKGDQDSFPTSNNDSIPSNRSAIVKYRTPREQMLDSLTVSSKAEEDEAKRKATKRVKAASSALKEIKNKNSSMDSGRFSRPATPLDNLGITTSSPATNSQSVFVRPPKPKVKQLRDLMRTTSGVDSRMFNKGLQTKIAYDPQAERQKAVRAALETKIIDQTDSTTEALINPGFFEAMGPDRIYLSETKKFHSADQRHAQQARLKKT